MGSMMDKAKGLANEAVGNIKQGIGRATNDKEMEADGFAQERKGEIQQTVGDAKDAVKRGVDRL